MPFSPHDSPSAPAAIRPLKSRTRLLLLLTGWLWAGCAFQGLFAGRNALEFYQGQARGPEIYAVDGGYALKASVHNHTLWSHGALSADELAAVAKSRGIAVLAITEHDNLEACWGKVICFRDPSVVKMGYANYWQQMAALQQKNPDLVILPGMEVAPYAWWTGVPPWLRLHGWDVHFTVYNLTDAAACQGMPTLANHRLQPAHPRRNRGEKPYQQFVAYIADHGGLVFLAHPESKAVHRLAAAKTVTPPYPEYARDLLGLTGFAVLPSGRDRLLKPGGIWDQTLAEYLAGKRRAPIWVLGDADFHGGDQQLDQVLTWIYAAGQDEASVLAAMRQGRMVAVQGPELAGLRVTEFGLTRPNQEKARIMLGQVSGDPQATQVRFALSRPVAGMSARLIRNGEVIFTARETRFAYDDSAYLGQSQPASYRVEVRGEGDFLLVTNPVFSRVGKEVSGSPSPIIEDRKIH